MTTIFDFKPTQSEIDSIAFNYLTLQLRCGKNVSTKELYIANIKPDWAKFDIAVLHEERGDQAAAQQYWDEIPAIAQEYKLGKDYVTLPA